MLISPHTHLIILFCWFHQRQEIVMGEEKRKQKRENKIQLVIHEAISVERVFEYNSLESYPTYKEQKITK